MSTLFPDRPIRPLPRRRLKERLSPEVADTIKYPVSPHHGSPIFRYPPYAVKEPSSKAGHGGTVSNASLSTASVAKTFGSREEGDVESNSTRTSFSTSLHETLNGALKSEQTRNLSSLSPFSTASSVDGHDFFETNNKKKRKIPSASDSAPHGSHSLGDLHNSPTSAAFPSAMMGGQDGLSRPSPTGSPGPSRFTGVGGHGFSGPGRGRFGRTTSARSPLRDILGGRNHWMPRAPRARSGAWPDQFGDNAHAGIISSAIANAERVDHSQENIDLRPEPLVSSNTSPTSGQFTFTCESQVPGSFQWPGSDSSSHLFGTIGGSHSRPNAMATQTAPLPMPSRSPNTASTQTDNPLSPVMSPRDAEKQKRQLLNKEYIRAAKQRRRQKQRENLAKPPRTEDIWICEFCEYQNIFGEPPRALIRRYEIREHDVRAQEEERKRLLEKAKAKSRKGKKGKAPAKVVGQTQVNDTVPPSANGQYLLPGEPEWAPLQCNNHHHGHDPGHDENLGHHHDHEHGHHDGNDPGHCQCECPHDHSHMYDPDQNNDLGHSTQSVVSDESEDPGGKSSVDGLLDMISTKKIASFSIRELDA